LSFDDLFAEFEEEEKPKEKPEEKPEQKPEAKPEEKPAEQPEEAPKEEQKPAEEQPAKEAEQKTTEEATEEAESFFEESAPVEQSIQPEAPAPAPKPLEELKEVKFDFEEAKGTGKIVVMDYGLKGHGKTYFAFSFPGKIVCLSFDRKSLAVKQQCFKGDDRIKVFDAIKYLDQTTPERYLESAELTFRYVNWLLDKAKELEPDWIVIDGSEIFQRICEMTMRYRNNLMPFQGIANRNLWKERRMYISQVHNKALSIARRGVIYTTYTDKDEIVKDGELVAKTDVPRWIDAIMYETDVVVRVYIEQGRDGSRRFIGLVESSKTNLLPTGKKADITGVGVKALIEKEGVT